MRLHHGMSIPSRLYIFQVDPLLALWGSIRRVQVFWASILRNKARNEEMREVWHACFYIGTCRRRAEYSSFQDLRAGLSLGRKRLPNPTWLVLRDGPGACSCFSWPVHRSRLDSHWSHCTLYPSCIVLHGRNVTTLPIFLFTPHRCYFFTPLPGPCDYCTASVKYPDHGWRP